MKFLDIVPFLPHIYIAGVVVGLFCYFVFSIHGGIMKMYRDLITAYKEKYELAKTEEAEVEHKLDDEVHNNEVLIEKEKLLENALNSQKVIELKNPPITRGEYQRLLSTVEEIAIHVRQINDRVSTKLVQGENGA